jgi:putative protease
MCRLPFSLADGQGAVIARDQHLLSLKDNDQTGNLRALADAGIRSFKIEGRLKDLSYVKNVTAHYRRQLDAILAEAPHYRAASAGRCTFTFEPRPEKTFNRGATDYFVNERQADILSARSPKFAGEPIGRVTRVGHGWFEVDGETPIHNGDGLTWFDAAGTLVGVRVNRAEGRRLFPAEAGTLPAAATPLYRNRDQAFERQLERRSAERRIGVRLQLAETATGLRLTLCDEEGVAGAAEVDHPRQPAENPERALQAIRDQLGRLGNTPFVAEAIELDLTAAWFVPAAVLNGLRRDAVERLQAARAAAYRRPPRAPAVEPPARYPEAELSYLGNVYNRLARAFYARHGVALIAPAYECNQERGEVSLMITRHCLRYSFNLCPRQVKGISPDPLVLMNGGERLTLRFDCKRCEMHVVGRLKVRRKG